MLNIGQLKYDYQKPFLNILEGCKEVRSKYKIKYINQGKLKLEIDFDGEINGKICFAYIHENDLIEINQLLNGNSEDVRTYISYLIHKHLRIKQKCVIGINTDPSPENGGLFCSIYG